MAWGVNTPIDPTKSLDDEASPRSDVNAIGGGAYVRVESATVKVGVVEGSIDLSIDYSKGLVFEGGYQLSYDPQKGKVVTSPSFGMNTPPVPGAPPIDYGWDTDPTKFGTDDFRLDQNLGFGYRGIGSAGGYLALGQPRAPRSNLEDIPGIWKGDLQTDLPTIWKGDLKINLPGIWKGDICAPLWDVNPLVPLPPPDWAQDDTAPPGSQFGPRPLLSLPPGSLLPSQPGLR